MWSKSTNYHLRAKALEFAYERAKEMHWYDIQTILNEADAIYSYLSGALDEVDLDNLDNADDPLMTLVTRVERLGRAVNRAEKVYTTR